MSEPEKMYPLMLLSDGMKVLVVGAGTVAERKINHLLNAGAAVTVIAPLLSPAVQVHLDNKSISLIQRDYQQNDISTQYKLIFAATDNSTTNQEIIDRAGSLNILCSAVDQHWVDGDFICPASFRHDNFTISISSAGKSPSDCKAIKEQLISLLKENKST